MKLLLQTDDDLRRHLPFLDADFDIERLNPTLYPACDALRKLVGASLYAALEGIYDADSASVTDTEFLRRAQQAVAYEAYRNLAADNDIGHTKNGRVNRVEDGQKIAFEWQIERSNRSLERKYYQALDGLIAYMDENISGWKSSDAYKSSYRSFVRTPDQFQDYFNIGDSRLLLIKLTPGMVISEREDILPRLGDKMELLRTALKNSDTVDELLLARVREVIVFRSLAWGIPRLSAQLFPEGLLQVADTSRLTTSARKSIERNEAEAFGQRFDRDANRALLNLEDYIKRTNESSGPPPPPLTPGFNCSDNFVDT